MNEFKAQLKHCPLMPMFYNHKRNDKIKRLREDVDVCLLPTKTMTFIRRFFEDV